jgi:2-hydroxy-3-keto-5-methylthiopentenyl-1-phosphate phosphatase
VNLIDKPNSTKEFLFLSDFDQTLSFQDSGHVLSEALGIPNFHEKVTNLAKKHLVQQGGELAYLLVHDPDPDFRKIRADDLRSAGKKVRLKPNISLLVQLLGKLEWHHFTPYVVSAGTSRNRRIGPRRHRSA